METNAQVLEVAGRRMTISRSGQVVRSVSATVPFGTRAYAWKPTRPGDYVVTLAAESFRGLKGAATGTIRVHAKP